MVVKQVGLIGSIKKTNEGYNINVSCKGWGNLSVYEVLEKLNLIDKLEKLPVNSVMIFEN